MTLYWPVVFYITQMKGSDIKWRHDISWRLEMTFLDFTHYATLKACKFFIFDDRSLNCLGMAVHG